MYRSIFSLIVIVSISACGPAADDRTHGDGADHDHTHEPASKSAAVEEFPPGASSLIEQDITYRADDMTLNGYLVYNRTVQGPRPGVLVVHEWWGHNDYARRRARMLADMGYIALAVDMYGDGKTAEHPDEASKFAGEVFRNLDAATARFNAAHELLRSQPQADSTRTAAIGYCFGGGVVLHLARFGADLKGVVSFHGSLATHHPARPGEVKASVLVCHGADDPFVSQEIIDAFKKEMDDAGVDYTFISYPGAMHSFTNPEADSNGVKFDLPLAYNADADNKSWEDMQRFFNTIFGP